MRLKKIKLAGFKSFVDPTTIPFPGDMTAIVGPNGCGKSNVIDAVRWVLGESSAKNLRGDAMTDVIFNGSSARKPVGQCSVELVFDNSAGRLVGEYANYNELSVKRIVTRDATSTYMLNGTKCRRRDVTDLFLGTGLGPRSYAIIEQGMISRLIESKPQDLRVFIEEAAGISKYKERRRETENRIRHTEDNLDRLEDVRTELGQQIEKLQRQAAAARRYTVLKASERELKSQLSAIRWLKHSKQIETIEKEISDHQADLDALEAQQAGDEAGLMVYQSQLQDLKSESETLQQRIFTVANQITRIEQNKQHSEQRKKQILEESAVGNERKTQLAHDANLLSEQYNQIEEHISAAEPALAVLEEKLWQAQQNREQAEMSLAQTQAKNRDLELTYASTKQEIQTSHSQVQSTMAMQLRTTQRIEELKSELDDLSHENDAERLELLQLQLEESETHLLDAKDLHEQTKIAVQQQRMKLTESEQVLKAAEQARLNTTSTLAALDKLQMASHSETGIEGLALWRSLKVKAGFEARVEAALGQLNSPLVINSIEELVQDGELASHGVDAFLQPWMSDTKRQNSLAEALENDFIPSVFNRILLANSLDEAISRRATLNPGECFMLPDCSIVGLDWVTKGVVDEQAKVIQREREILQLKQHLSKLEEDENAAAESVESVRVTLNEAQSRVETCYESVTEAHAKQQHIHQTLALANNQQAQNTLKHERLTQELARQQGLLDNEVQQLEELSNRLEILEARLLEQESAALESTEIKESLEREVASEKAIVERLVEEKHASELALQQHESQKVLVGEKLATSRQGLEDVSERLLQLNSELETLTHPQAVQEHELQDLLESRSTAEEQKQTLLQKINETEALINDAQKGSQGLVNQIQQRKTKLDSCKIDLEGARVRAMATLELLEETGDSLKTVLSTLPADADESKWQTELERTTSAVSRLGAVNLAAVEEFETQSQRKAHLDEQHDDLETALETLRSAIRKIDKETRTRFSDTFEQVNSDLKMLFPKVFGGGSAYLALTDDDLLETGVTIMARPPGKKNSTIHLLSGGEKALTALSLVFAIFRLNPAPFCLLDEVDAPLDDANVGRFCNLVSEMSKSVQFIYITHNKIAMEMASHLTGVTMAEPGVSRMVAVDVEQAVSFVEA